jgi:hypothetical protein
MPSLGHLLDDGQAGLPSNTNYLLRLLFSRHPCTRDVPSFAGRYDFGESSLL